MAKKKKTTKKQAQAEQVQEPETKKEPESSTDFDLGKFDSAVFVPREADVPVPAAADFYPEGVTPVMRVRGLYGDELARIEEYIEMNRRSRKILKDDSFSEEVVSAVRTILRSYDRADVPDNHVKALHYVHIGLVEPKLDYQQVVKFAKRFPIEFRTLWYKIMGLTGLGMDQGK